MKVKTIKPHSNGHGEKYSKTKGDEYDHPNPTADIKAGFVKEVKSDDIQGKGRGLSGHGAKPLSTKKHDGKKRRKAGDEKEPRGDEATRSA